MSYNVVSVREKGVRLLSVVGLWPIVEKSVVSENGGTTVRQTVADTITCPRMPFSSKGVNHMATTSQPQELAHVVDSYVTKAHVGRLLILHFELPLHSSVAKHDG